MSYSGLFFFLRCCPLPHHHRQVSCRSLVQVCMGHKVSFFFLSCSHTFNLHENKCNFNFLHVLYGTFPKQRIFTKLSDGICFSCLTICRCTWFLGKGHGEQYASVKPKSNTRHTATKSYHPHNWGPHHVPPYSSITKQVCIKVFTCCRLTSIQICVIYQSKCLNTEMTVENDKMMQLNQT